MNDIQEPIAKRNIEEVVRKMNCNKNNYIFINNKFITQQILIYDKQKIITFFVRHIKKNDSLKVYQQKWMKYFHSNSLLFSLINYRTGINEYKVDLFEDIAFLDEDRQLFFIDNYGTHYFKIAKTDIYGFDQTEQIDRLKEFVNEIYENIKKKK